MPDKERKASARDKEKAKETAHTPAWDRMLLARHTARPHTLDFINGLTKNFVELHGDRHFGDDAALVGGLAQFEGRAVVVIGTQKGRDTKENLFRNFGLPKPEGYRKSYRLMQHAAKFKLPVLTFIDVQGAFPGKEGEERGVAVAIAENLMLMSRLPVPVIAVVTGEGGSGGALAIGVADRLLMLENAVYSVVSPEGCATILWRDASQAPAAAQAMKITAPDLLEFNIIDEIVPEPPGGAHNDPAALMVGLRQTLNRHLTELEDRYTKRGSEGLAEMLEARYAKYRQIGRWIELSEEQLGVSSLAGVL